jgi:hypothetical protein
MANSESALSMVAILVGLPLCAAFGQSNKLVIDSDEYNYTATLNSDRVSAGELRELLSL